MNIFVMDSIYAYDCIAEHSVCKITIVLYSLANNFMITP